MVVVFNRGKRGTGYWQVGYWLLIDHRHTHEAWAQFNLFLQHSYVFVEENFPFCPKIIVKEMSKTEFTN